MAKEISKQELVAEIKRLGGKASIKERKEDLKCKLEDLKNERFYEKYGRPTENAMENETQKCIDNIIASLTKKEEEKEVKNMNTEAEAIVVNTENTNANKEEKNMNTEAIVATENTEAVVEKKTRKHANADAVYAAIDAGLTLPEYITLVKMRDGYVFKAKNRRVAEVWKCRANVRIVTTAEHADMFDATLCIDVTIRQRDGWVNHIVNAENVVEALENFFNAATFF